MQTLDRPASLQQLRTPLVARIARPLPEGLMAHDAPDRYDPRTQLIEEGVYFMGSPKSNTRCNSFTILGRDRTYQDDTREKKD